MDKTKVYLVIENKTHYGAWSNTQYKAIGMVHSLEDAEYMVWKLNNDGKSEYGAIVTYRYETVESLDVGKKDRGFQKHIMERIESKNQEIKENDENLDKHTQSHKENMRRLHEEIYKLRSMSR
jgi:hypothetical protein